MLKQCSRYPVLLFIDLRALGSSLYRFYTLLPQTLLSVIMLCFMAPVALVAAAVSRLASLVADQEKEKVDSVAECETSSGPDGPNDGDDNVVDYAHVYERTRLVLACVFEDNEERREIRHRSYDRY